MAWPPTRSRSGLQHSRLIWPEISHLMTDGFIFEYWVDHAVKQVIITEIDNVE